MKQEKEQTPLAQLKRDRANLKAIFEDNPLGAAVFESLVKRHYNIQSFVAGDPYATAFNEGRRSVVQEIANIMYRDLTTEEDVEDNYDE